jgi:hypothetical protein
LADFDLTCRNHVIAPKPRLGSAAHREAGDRPMKLNNNVLIQQSRPTSQIPTQPLIKTIGKGDMPRVSLAGTIPHEIISVAAMPSNANPIGWNGAGWHDGAD